MDDTQALSDARSELARRAAAARWSKTSPAQRRAETEPANKARGRVADVAEKVDALGVELLAELRALHARLDQIESSRDEQRVAA